MKKIYFGAVLILFLIVACDTSKITSSWKATNVEAAKYKKILVLGLINDPDRRVREKMEEHLVADLRDLGYDAVCSCEEFGPKSFENMKEQEALTRLSNGQIEAVLTIVLLDKQKEKYYVPGRVHYTPYGIYQNRFWGYYITMYDRVYSPGYYTEDTKYFWESNFYSLNNGPQLLYSAQSQSFQPGTTGSLGHEYAQMIIRDMLKNSILVNQKEAKPKPM